MKPKEKYKDEAKWIVVIWKMIKKGLLHNFPNEYCNGKVYGDEVDGVTCETK